MNIKQMNEISKDKDFKKKKAWTKQEDERLVSTIGGTNSDTNDVIWPDIADRMPDRSAKQCRERYSNHLQANLKKGEWTPEEDKLILALQEQSGPIWASMCKLLPGRAGNAIKNRWHLLDRNKNKPHESKEASTNYLTEVFNATFGFTKNTKNTLGSTSTTSLLDNRICDTRTMTSRTMSSDDKKGKLCLNFLYPEVHPASWSNNNSVDVEDHQDHGRIFVVPSNDSESSSRILGNKQMIHPSNASRSEDSQEALKAQASQKPVGLHAMGIGSSDSVDIERCKTITSPNENVAMSFRQLSDGNDPNKFEESNDAAFKDYRSLATNTFSTDITEARNYSLDSFDKYETLEKGQFMLSKSGSGDVGDRDKVTDDSDADLLESLSSLFGGCANSPTGCTCGRKAASQHLVLDQEIKNEYDRVENSSGSGSGTASRSLSLTSLTVEVADSADGDGDSAARLGGGWGQALGVFPLTPLGPRPPRPPGSTISDFSGLTLEIPSSLSARLLSHDEAQYILDKCPSDKWSAEDPDIVSALTTKVLESLSPRWTRHLIHSPPSMHRSPSHLRSPSMRSPICKRQRHLA